MKYTLIASLLSAAVYAAPANQATQQAQGTSPNTNALAASLPKSNITPSKAALIPNTASAGTDVQLQASAAGANKAPLPNGQLEASAAGITQANSPQAVSALTALKVTPGSSPGVPQGQTPTNFDLATAVANWQADTSMVSKFLDIGMSITDENAFKQAAAVAYNAEVDELNHKAVIDAATGTDPKVQAANSTLATGGSFQQVVDLLLEMAVVGTAAKNDIGLIVNNRCVNVLPNIDAYMASTGSNLQSIRPLACNQNGVINGVQGQGATQPGGAPGTPAAALDAAAKLAAGQGNGQVNNAAFPIGGAAPAASAQTAQTAQTAGAAKAGAKTPATAGAATAPAAKAPAGNAATKGAATVPAAAGAKKAN